MQMNIYAVYDTCREAIIRFDFGNTDASFVRDNLNRDLYDPKTQTGTPLKDLDYIRIGRVDLDKIELIPETKVHLAKLKLYDFKVHEEGSKNEEHQEKKTTEENKE